MRFTNLIHDKLSPVRDDRHQAGMKSGARNTCLMR